MTAVPGRVTVPDVPWLTKLTEPPEVTGTAWPTPRSLTVDCQVTSHVRAPKASVPLPDHGIEVCALDDLGRRSAVAKEPATTATPVLLGTSTDTVTGMVTIWPML